MFNIGTVFIARLCFIYFGITDNSLYFKVCMNQDVLWSCIKGAAIAIYNTSHIQKEPDFSGRLVALSLLILSTSVLTNNS